MAAGICTVGILFMLGVTGLMQLVYRLIPISVVRGIQLAQGGLAGQYKFGSRSGGCVALLGVAKLVLGSSMVKVLTQFLVGVGVFVVLLLFAGIELAMCSRGMNTKEESFVVLVCTSVSLVGSSGALGFLCGIVVHLVLKMRKMGSDGGQSCSSVHWLNRNP
ncbi:hypothetical protein K7X08_037681 [Anisodus acutangulus]|uniref:Uncharacterized protein n=1 Tax=Anisodus acutangulus TaxID=402998 RepID=A0A9Q1MWX5_9SOLA|nr:hypothetical protein K7X08_037681 [Anisodus acutangulus]